ncbi:MAG: DUF6314 family protein, partial [Tateyamaria sp.]
GVWALHRTIRHGDGTRATFTGEAIWTPDPQGMIYREHGHLQMPASPPMQAERRYIWRAGVDVFFEDGRFFHHVPDGGGTAEHWCDPDTYNVTYDFAAWPSFSTVWQVTGPKKSYEMTSEYKRRACKRA